MIQTNFGPCLLAALMLLVLPLDWYFSAVLAAAFHELCHIFAVLFMRGQITKIRIQTGGCVMEACGMEEWQQFFSILTGPAGSFALLMLCRIAPKIAVCGLLQGLYNMLPVLPLDGGRLLRLLLYLLCPLKADKIMDFITIGSCIVLDFLALWFNITIFPVPLFNLFVLLWNIKVLSGKIPCKQSEIGVQ